MQNFSSKSVSQILQYQRTTLSSLIAQVTILFLLFSYGTCLGQNPSYIINGNFTTPVVPDRQLFEYYSMLGWNCTWVCQLKNCRNQLAYWTSQGELYGDCIDQAIDLNSIFFNEEVSQQIQLSNGSYTLCFNYYYPVMESNLKELKVSFNSVTILDIIPTISASAQRYYAQIIIQAVEGTNILTFQNLGYADDGYGFRINNVSLYNYTTQNNTQNSTQNNTSNTTQNTTQNATQNTTQNATQNTTQNTTQNATQSLNETKSEIQTDVFLSKFTKFFFQKSSFSNNIPGGRVIFRSVLSFLINFDRLQLYIYHNRLYSENTQLLILSVNNFLSTKTVLANRVLSTFNDGLVQYENRLAKLTNNKTQYVSYPSFSQDYQNSEYLGMINESFVYFFPFIIVFTILFNILFKILFQRPISLLFRKFQLYAIVLIMIFDGNIENTAFHTFAEFKVFFSQCVHHKMVNVFIIMFFYLLFFIVFALLFWVKYHYSKKAKFILDEAESRLEILWEIVIDRGIICFLFGIAHQFLINSPNLQLLLLGLLQLLWIIKKIIYIYKKFYKQQLLVITSMLSGFLRISFQVSFYLYQKQEDYRYFINQYIHSSLIYAIISAALLEIIIGLFYCLKQLCTIWKINQQKIGNSGSQIKRIKTKTNKTQLKTKNFIFTINKPNIHTFIAIMENQLSFVKCRVKINSKRKGGKTKKQRQLDDLPFNLRYYKVQ